MKSNYVRYEMVEALPIGGRTRERTKDDGEGEGPIQVIKRAGKTVFVDSSQVQSFEQTWAEALESKQLIKVTAKAKAAAAPTGTGSQGSGTPPPGGGS